ncbi:MAG: hotdog fold thioesterase [Euryarchaeota archaeon]|jgi:uncharacterized protein (TIGR00369 family)|nr:PaaI family thioesterase [Thermoplasmata archaeon]MVT35889.1 hotdog fold thioesterase [Euryarchaeota archaeon]
MESNYDILKSLIESDPFLRYVSIHVIEMKEGYAKLSMDFREEITRIGNMANGGALATLADATGGASVLSLMEGKNQVTVSLNIDFLEPVKNGPVIAEGKVIRKGKNLVFSEIKIFDGMGKLCAHATGIWFYLP